MTQSGAKVIENELWSMQACTAVMLHAQPSFIQPEAWDKPLNSLRHNATTIASQLQHYYWSDKQVTPVHVALIAV